MIAKLRVEYSGDSAPIANHPILAMLSVLWPRISVSL
jgi:hypothetical protein